MGILERIKEESKKAGKSKGKFLYCRPDEKKRIRFLSDFDEGMEIVFHDSFEQSINVPCQELYGEECPYCEMEDLRTRSLFLWSVYDYEDKEVKILMQAVNQCTAVATLAAIYDNNGTLLDRDITLIKRGSGSSTNYAVLTNDKNTFKNTKAKPLSEQAIIKILREAYPADGESEEEEEYKPKKKEKKGYMNKPTGFDEEEDDIIYEDMTPLELYRLCKKREIEVLPKKSQKYYIKQLQEFDKMQDDWNDEEEDDWEE